MADHDRQDDGTVSVRAVEIVVAAVLMIIAVVVMVDNLRIGIGWAYDGPEAGYFPFYVGLVLFLASTGTLLINLFGRSPDLGSFVGRSQLGLVLKVLVPTIIFVALIGVLGLYVAAALFIAFFMYWLGKYPVVKIVPVAILVPAVLFLMFELWFLVPLPKGPLEAMLGY
ncbi:tripartite tricarboxylate transporter TctB family protein [Inquilinus limosus]|uniref:tripartite tricarboxylate transporter TctB family protein n=1 Tax=Inquilinus limosus TaxID=171674 RepID=UPI003F14A4A1